MPTIGLASLSTVAPDTQNRVFAEVFAILRLCLAYCSARFSASVDQLCKAVQVIEAIRKKYMNDPAFTPEVAKKASSAAEGMCKWVHAMNKYEAVAKVVAPKQAKLAEAEAQYEEVMVGLRTLQADLQVLMDKLAAMEADLAHNTGLPASCNSTLLCCPFLHA